MEFNQPITEIIRQRYSCRTYLARSIQAETRRQLQNALTALDRSPFGSCSRFELVAATEEDTQILRGLGTYGFIKHAAGFIVGAVEQGDKALEDYGYVMEGHILTATGLGLGTCWLGGTFTKSKFAKKIKAAGYEIIPAVTAIGYAAEDSYARDSIRRQVRATERLPWETLFFSEQWGRPLLPEAAGEYVTPLDMVRLGPSASNKQPWRIIKMDNTWHFYLQRTQGYGRGSLMFTLLRLADLQRVDLGIAMSHFELTARELGLSGQWQIVEPDIALPVPATEYIASWVAEGTNMVEK